MTRHCNPPRPSCPCPPPCVPLCVVPPITVETTQQEFICYLKSQIDIIVQSLCEKIDEQKQSIDEIKTMVGVGSCHDGTPIPTQIHQLRANILAVEASNKNDITNLRELVVPVVQDTNSKLTCSLTQLDTISTTTSTISTTTNEMNSGILCNKNDIASLRDSVVHLVHDTNSKLTCSLAQLDTISTTTSSISTTTNEINSGILGAKTDISNLKDSVVHIVHDTNAKLTCSLAQLDTISTNTSETNASVLCNNPIVSKIASNLEDLGCVVPKIEKTLYDTCGKVDAISNLEMDTNSKLSTLFTPLDNIRSAACDTVSKIESIVSNITDTHSKVESITTNAVEMQCKIAAISSSLDVIRTASCDTHSKVDVLLNASVSDNCVRYAQGPIVIPNSC